MLIEMVTLPASTCSPCSRPAVSSSTGSARGSSWEALKLSGWEPETWALYSRSRGCVEVTPLIEVTSTCSCSPVGNPSRTVAFIRPSPPDSRPFLNSLGRSSAVSQLAGSARAGKKGKYLCASPCSLALMFHVSRPSTSGSTVALIAPSGTVTELTLPCRVPPNVTCCTVETLEKTICRALEDRSWCSKVRPIAGLGVVTSAGW